MRIICLIGIKCGFFLLPFSLVFLLYPNGSEAQEVNTMELKTNSFWYNFQFRWFDDMKDEHMQEFRKGFPPGLYGSPIIPFTMWFHLWCGEKARRLLVPTYMQLAERNCFIVPVISGDCYPFTSIDQMSVIYIYQICHMFESWQMPNLDMETLCPNTCLGKPCEAIDNAISGTCIQSGYHSNDFICSCVMGYDWDNSTQVCTLVDTCTEICHPENTLQCVTNITTGGTICKCKDSYMGYDCSQILDSCMTARSPDTRGLDIGPHIPSGNQGCGTELDASNHCEHIENTTSYVCRCGSLYGRDLTLPYDNCLRPKDSCDGRICVYGQCVSSPDLSISACDCETDYTGPKCDKKLDTWSMWSTWTPCDPICGPVRHRRRLRFCLSESEANCFGSVEEVRQCDKDTTCLSHVNIEEETWIRFMEWTLRTMKYTLSYMGGLCLLLNLIGLCRPHSEESFQYRFYRRLTRMSQVGGIVHQMTKFVRRTRGNQG